MAVASLVHADRGDPKTEEAGVVTGELRLDRAVIHEIVVEELDQPGMAQPGRMAPDREHALDAGVAQAFAQHACPTMPVAPNRMTFMRFSRLAGSL
jgi:hypothetical protein